jgi:hypothetical protein
VEVKDAHGCSLRASAPRAFPSLYPLGTTPVLSLP